MIAAVPPAAVTTAPAAPVDNQPRRAPRREQSLAQKYHAPLRSFMSFRDGITYSREHDFTREQLEPITANEFYR